MARQAVAASCPGKVLAAGGYVVLEKPNTGLVVATASRFYAVASELERLNQEEPAASKNSMRVSVESPQFLGARWDYTLTFHQDSGLWSIAPGANQTRNPFVQAAVHGVTAFLSAFPTDSSNTSTTQGFLDYNAGSNGCRVLVFGDNDFYTQKSHDPPPLADLGCSIGDVHKTGLGSSAAMTTALTSALLHYLAPEQVRSEIDQQVLHNLAQFVHASAQGKIGSGFDVSSAVYGTHLYSRFAPSCIGSLLETNLDQIQPTLLAETISPRSNVSWKEPDTAAQVLPLSLPPLTTLLLADVDAGSNTPSMVSSVLKWRKSKPDEAAPIWSSLISRNQELAQLFLSLNDLWKKNPSTYEQQISSLLDSNNSSLTGECCETMRAVQTCMKAIRESMKAMGDSANVGIEPDSQTILLDTCCALPGVVGAGVPGAGGLDAIYVLAITPPGKDTVIRAIEALWQGWTQAKVTALSASSRSSGPGCKPGTALQDSAAGKEAAFSGAWIGQIEHFPAAVQQRLRGASSAVQQEQ